MSREDEMVQLLTDVRDTQREAAARQREHLDLARVEAERMKRVGQIVLPLIVVLMALVVWLIVKYRIL